jgi:hypothetical protein
MDFTFNTIVYSLAAFHRIILVINWPTLPNMSEQLIACSGRGNVVTARLNHAHLSWLLWQGYPGLSGLLQAMARLNLIDLSGYAWGLMVVKAGKTH